MISVYEFTDYKSFLQKRIYEAQQRGFATRLAEAAGCQRSYFSSVLNGSIHLLPDHLFGICKFLELSGDEQEYLFLVLDHNRASQSEYRQHLGKKIHDRRTAWKDLKNRLRKDSLDEAESSSEKQFYYSSWLFAAIHIAVSIPRMGDIQNLAKYLSITESVVQYHLTKLEQMGLVEKRGTRWSWKSGDLHLSKDSPWIGTHHANWRMQALANIQTRDEEALHYSVVQSLSKEDIDQLRSRMIEWVEEFKRKASPSRPEELMGFTLDFFKPGK